MDYRTERPIDGIGYKSKIEIKSRDKSHTLFKKELRRLLSL